jgi:hypothetical protein
VSALREVQTARARPAAARAVAPWSRRAATRVDEPRWTTLHSAAGWRDAGRAGWPSPSVGPWGCRPAMSSDRRERSVPTRRHWSVTTGSRQTSRAPDRHQTTPHRLGCTSAIVTLGPLVRRPSGSGGPIVGGRPPREPERTNRRTSIHPPSPCTAPGPTPPGSRRLPLPASHAPHEVVARLYHRVAPEDHSVEQVRGTPLDPSRQRGRPSHALRGRPHQSTSRTFLQPLALPDLSI